jgi:hypothetical protein
MKCARAWSPSTQRYTNVLSIGFRDARDCCMEVTREEGALPRSAGQAKVMLGLGGGLVLLLLLLLFALGRHDSVHARVGDGLAEVFARGRVNGFRFVARASRTPSAGRQACFSAGMAGPGRHMFAHRRRLPGNSARAPEVETATGVEGAWPADLSRSRPRLRRRRQGKRGK